MKNYIKLLRVKHYVKNVLVFLPLFFAGELFNLEKICLALMGVVCFSLISSSIYIINDLRDVENDRKHPKKKLRPIASGKVKKSTAFGILFACLFFALTLSLCIGNYNALGMLLLYFALNNAYSFGLKNKPILDVLILASGFVIRIFYGGFLTEVPISVWLYLVVATGSLYMGLGKRRNELVQQTEIVGSTRAVLSHYSVAFLDKNMYVCVALANVFYALWTKDFADPRMAWTVPFFIVILMCYSLDVENGSDGDPVEVIMHDKILIGLIIAYAVCVFSLLYMF